MKLFIKEILTDRDHGRYSSDEPIYETRHSKLGDLYRGLIQEHGRCISKIYRDLKDGSSQAIGWVFQKRDKNDDGQWFVRETWVEVHSRVPLKTVQYFEVDIDAA